MRETLAYFFTGVTPSWCLQTSQNLSDMLFLLRPRLIGSAFPFIVSRFNTVITSLVFLFCFVLSFST